MSKVGQANKYERIRREREARRDWAIFDLLQRGCRKIAEYPDYLVSPRGEIFSSLRRTVIELSPGIKPGGYQFVGLKNAAGTRYKMVHRLVAEAFIQNPLGLCCINHIDGKKTNNRVENLEWCSHEQNSRHALAIGLQKRGLERPNSKLTAEKVMEIRAAHGTYKNIAARYGISAQTVCNIKNDRLYYGGILR